MRSVKVKPTNVEEEEGKKSKKDSGSTSSSYAPSTDITISKREKEEVEKRYVDTAKVVYKERVEEMSEIMRMTCHENLAQGYLLLGRKKAASYCSNGNTPIYFSRSDSKPSFYVQKDCYSYIISPPTLSPPLKSLKKDGESFANTKTNGHSNVSSTQPQQLPGNPLSDVSRNTISSGTKKPQKVETNNRPKKKICSIS